MSADTPADALGGIIKNLTVQNNAYQRDLTLQNNAYLREFTNEKIEAAITGVCNEFVILRKAS